MPFQIDPKQLNLVASPHIKSNVGTQHIMLMVIISLLPICVYGVILFGIPALVSLLTAVVSCLFFEAATQKILKRPIQISNLSAIITGLLLSLTLSPAVPAWMIIIGSFFAIVVGKEFFGGIGANVFNPALIGRGFMVLSFAGTMGKWIAPGASVDGMSSATVLADVKAGNVTFDAADYLKHFIGNEGGTIGETSAMLIILAAIFLLITKIIDWRTPVFMVGTVALCVFFTGEDIIAHVLSGGLLFGAIFMATDYATAPVTSYGRMIFGAGCGLITFLIREFGGLPEGVMFSILIMNAITPFLNKLTTRQYGQAKKFGGKK